MGNPLDDYLEHESGTEKTAFFGRLGRKILTGAGQATTMEGLGTLGMQMGMVAGAEMLVGAAQKAYAAATKNQHQKQMFAVNPDLVEAQKADPVMFNQYYSSLRTMNPQFAADPVVAGGYMRQMVENPQGAHGVLVNALGASKGGPAGGGVRDFSTGLDIAGRAAPPSQMEQLRLQEAKSRKQKAEEDARRSAYETEG